MVARFLLRFPWFVSAPGLALMALLMAVASVLIAGPYFERTTISEADPFAGLSVAPAATAAATVTGGGATTPAAGAASGAGSRATVAAGGAGAPVALGQGEFADADPVHKGRGLARLLRAADGMTVLRFERFSVTNGPDLRVILSTDPAGGRASAAAADALDLGKLKATDGDQNYTVPAGADLARYRSVIIYCKPFSIVFAVARLEAPR